MTPLPPPDPLTLARYLSEELTAAEAAQVERWIAADSANRELVESLRAIWSPSRPPEFDPGDALWKRIVAEMEPDRPKPAVVQDRRRVWAPRWQSLRRVPVMLSAAAAVLVIASVALLERARQSTAPAPIREVATRRSQRAVLDLPDGSRAVLAPDSRLRFSTSYGDRSKKAQTTSRDLFLEGQAYFVVRHDSTRPFRVHTATAVVEDRGTEFVVAAYPESRGLDVVVVSGLVALRRVTHDGGASPDLLTLARGDLARLDSSGTAILKANVNLAPYVAWTEGNLVFDATPLGEVAPALGRWYDLDVRVADRALVDRRLTASFRHEPVSQVLELIARSLDARVERDGRSVVFRLDSH